MSLLRSVDSPPLSDIWSRYLVKAWFWLVSAHPRNVLLVHLHFLGEFDLFGFSYAEFRVPFFHKGHSFEDLIGARVWFIHFFWPDLQVSQIFHERLLKLYITCYFLEDKFFL